MIPRHLVRLLLSLALLSAARAGESDALALAERALPGLGPILESAARQSPRMVSRALDLEIAENNRRAARAGLLPSVGAQGRQVESRDDRADQPTTLSASKVYYDVSLTQPIFHWGERRNGARIGEIQQQIAQGNFREAYRGLAQEVRQRYLSLVVQKRALARARDYVAFTAQQVRLAEERLAKKVISGLEIYPVRVAAEQAEIALERAEFDFETAKASFARLTGARALQDAEIPDAIPALSHQPGPVDRLLAGFLAAAQPPTPEALTLALNREIEELNYRNNKTRLRPKFNLVAGANQDEQSYTLNTAQRYRLNSVYAGVSVNWTLFDGFSSQMAVRNSLARLRQLELDREEMVHRLGQQAQGQAKQIYFSARSMVIADRGLVSAEGNLKSKQEEFARGAVSESDVSLAGLQLHDARIAAFNARADYLQRVGDFLGTLAADPAVSHADANLR